MDAEEDEYTENLYTYLTLCGEPTLYEGLKFAKDLIIANISLRLLIQYVKLPHNVRHSFSLLIGSFLLFNNIGMAYFWTVILAVGAYISIAIFTLIAKRQRGLLTSIVVIIFLLTSEMFVVNPKMWQQIRGIQMIASMKIISVAIDLDRDLFKQIPNPVEFGGYVFCPANCILGPWICFHKYNQYMDFKFLSRNWIKIIIVNLVLSMLFLILSNCIVPWYIGDDMSKWLLAYRDAQAFRMSHYFVSTMSTVSMISAGFGLTNDCKLEVEVCKPYYVELPRSLVQVVIYWNIPMHQWLKTYVFKTCQPYGHFLAIFVTYAISSLLHGLNFQLSAVLLSIGTFSYVEYKLRSKISSVLNVCCLVNPCKLCTHCYKGSSVLAIVLNIAFTVLALMHLAYLGVMFEASFSIQESGYSYSHTLSKWENLHYSSHCIVAFAYVVYLLM